MKFRDADGNGQITYDTKDMVEIGNPNPKFTWGFNVDLDYKRFDFNVLFMGAQDFDVYRNIEASTMNMDGVFNVLDKAKEFSASGTALSCGEIFKAVYPEWRDMVSKTACFILSKSELRPISASPSNVERRLNFSPEWVKTFLQNQGLTIPD